MLSSKMDSLPAVFKDITLVTRFTVLLEGPVVGKFKFFPEAISCSDLVWPTSASASWCQDCCWPVDGERKTLAYKQTSGLPHDSSLVKEYPTLTTSEGSRYSLAHTKVWNLCFLFHFIFLSSTIGFVLFWFFFFSFALV